MTQRYQMGQVVSVRDFRLQRWRSGRVIAAGREQMTVSIEPNVVFAFHVSSPYVRPIRIVYPRSSALRGAA